MGRHANHGLDANSVLMPISEAKRQKTPDAMPAVSIARQRQIRLDEHQIEQLVQAYRDGDSTYALSRRFGIHWQTVTTHLQRAGVGLRPRGAHKKQ